MIPLDVFESESVAANLLRFASVTSERNTSCVDILGDAAASPLSATLSQRQLYPTNNLLRMSVGY